jgi:hypothetical protein
VFHPHAGGAVAQPWGRLRTPGITSSATSTVALSEPARDVTWDSSPIVERQPGGVLRDVSAARRGW